MKTDSLFYRLFQQQPEIFFELLPDSPAQAAAYEFASVEVKQLAFRMDGLFLPKQKDSRQPFYVVEVQFQADEELYYRLFAELFLYLRQYQPPHPWRVVVIYPSRRVEQEQAYQFGDLLALERVTRIYLDEMEVGMSLGVGIVKLIVEKEATAPAMAQNLLQKATQASLDERKREEIFDIIEAIVVYKFPKKSRQEIARMLGIEGLKQTRFYQEAFAEGRQEAEVQLVWRQLNRRLGNLDPSLEQQIRRLSVEQVETLAEALLDFSSVEDLQAWLQQQ